MILSPAAPCLAALVSTRSRDACSPAAALLLAVVRPGAAALAARLTRVALPAGPQRRVGGRPSGVSGGPASAEER